MAIDPDALTNPPAPAPFAGSDPVAPEAVPAPAPVAGEVTADQSAGAEPSHTVPTALTAEEEAAAEEVPTVDPLSPEGLRADLVGAYARIRALERRLGI
ncbi:MAG: hypothetical protein WB116_02135 [Candidatus Dormiibacterota bacterium]